MPLDIYQLVSLAKQVAYQLERANISQDAGLHIHPAYLAKILCLTVDDSPQKNQELLRLLDDIHTETMPNERRFLLSFFKHIWDGQSNVLEIGPFLGGSTRAIALGMMAHPSRNLETRLYTFDRFAKYHQPEQLIQFLRPMFDRGGFVGTRKNYNPRES